MCADGIHTRYMCHDDRAVGRSCGDALSLFPSLYRNLHTRWRRRKTPHTQQRITIEYVNIHKYTFVIIRRAQISSVSGLAYVDRHTALGEHAARYIMCIYIESLCSPVIVVVVGLVFLRFANTRINRFGFDAKYTNKQCGWMALLKKN